MKKSLAAFMACVGVLGAGLLGYALYKKYQDDAENCVNATQRQPATPPKGKQEIQDEETTSHSDSPTPAYGKDIAPSSREVSTPDAAAASDTADESAVLLCEMPAAWAKKEADAPSREMPDSQIAETSPAQEEPPAQTNAPTDRSDAEDLPESEKKESFCIESTDHADQG